MVAKIALSTIAFTATLFGVTQVTEICYAMDMQPKHKRPESCEVCPWSQGCKAFKLRVLKKSKS
jgi:hypothetical protein